MIPPNDMPEEQNIPEPILRHLGRYLEHMPATTDQTLLVLKGHLLLEELLSEIIDTYLPHPEHLADARLTFSQRLNLVRAMCWTKNRSDIWPVIAAVNSLRNELAHSLDAPKSKERFARLRQSILNSIDDETLRDQVKESSDESQIRTVVVYTIGFLVTFLDDVRAFREVTDALQLDPSAPRLSDRKRK